MDFEYPNAWEHLKNAEKPIIIYGMGNGADKILDVFESKGIKAAGVMASDDFVRRQSFRGFTVKKLSDLEKEFGELIIVLCFGSSLEEVIGHIYALAKEYELLAPYVPVVGEDIIDDAFIEENEDSIKAAFELLADEDSRAVYKGVINYYYTGRIDYLKAVESEKSEAFNNILKLKNESFLDLGAYRGDTVDEFLRFTDGYTSITAVEPNPKNHNKLAECIKSIPDATAVNAGISDRSGVMYISKNAGRMASLNAEKGVPVPVIRVDDIDIKPTYIKADIEGMESAMLEGAVNMLKTKPKLNIAAYHRTGDFFRLILRINKLNPDYKIYLRKHPYIPCWDLNIYAI